MSLKKPFANSPFSLPYIVMHEAILLSGDTNTNAAPVAAIALHAQHLFNPDPARVRQAASAIRQILRTHPVRIVSALDHAMRDRGFHRNLDLRCIETTTEDFARSSAAVGQDLPTLAAIASLVRNGYVRQNAVDILGLDLGLLSTAFLLCRLNDYVPEVVDTAWSSLKLRLFPRYASVWVAVLPLLSRLAQWKRAMQSPADAAVRALLCSDDPSCLAALWNGTESPDSEVRRQACAFLARRYAGQSEMLRVLSAALDDPDPVTRRWASDLARERAQTPADVLSDLLGRMQADRCPSVRLAALREHARAGSADHVISAAFDANAEVRFFARKFLRRLGVTIDFRSKALELLAHRDTSSSALLGALATLSEFGQQEDAALVERFQLDERPSIAHEAQRTLRLLPT